MPAVGCTVGLDGIEDRDALDGQWAGVCHPSERNRVTCRSLDVEDLEGYGGLTALAHIELLEGHEGGGAGLLAGQEVDAVREVGEVDVEDVSREIGIEGAVDEEGEAGDEVVHVGILQTLCHAGVVVTEGSPPALRCSRCREDGGEEGRGCDEGCEGVHLCWAVVGVGLMRV